MCHLCRARELSERIERQIKAIDGDGAISPSAIRAILADARDTIRRFHNAAALSDMTLSGAKIDVDVDGLSPPHGETVN